VDFEVRRGSRSDVDRLERLWLALRAHHATLPAMPPVRTPEASWDFRRGQYLEWLGGGGHTLLLAERDDEVIGYALVSVGAGAATWDIGDRVAEIETLSVLEGERGKGVGRALTEAAAEVAKDAGAGSVAVGVAHTNENAIRFYEREGFKPFYVLMLNR